MLQIKENNYTRLNVFLIFSTRTYVVFKCDYYLFDYIFCNSDEN